jgi:hypothetical protein
MPIWAAWCAGRAWFEGGRLTRRARNLAANPAITVGIELPGDGALIVEGMTVYLAAPPDGLTQQLVTAFAKYARPPRGYVPDPANWSSPGVGSGPSRRASSSAGPASRPTRPGGGSAAAERAHSRPAPT